MIEDKEIESRTPREMRTPTTSASELLCAISQGWADWHNNGDDDYLKIMLSETLDTEITDGDENISLMLGDFDSVKSEGLPDGRLPDMVIAMLIAGACCVEAIKADKSGKRDLAWTFFADAKFWDGKFFGSCSGRCDRKSVISGLARSAALERHKENHQMKEMVMEWMAKNGGNYKSKDAAAEAIASKVVPMKFRTVRNWIKEPPKK